MNTMQEEESDPEERPYWEEEPAQETWDNEEIPEEEPYWGEELAQEAWDEEEAQLYPTQLADRGAEPEPHTTSSSWNYPAPVTRNQRPNRRVRKKESINQRIRRLEQETTKTLSIRRGPDPAPSQRLSND